MGSLGQDLKKNSFSDEYILNWKNVRGDPLSIMCEWAANFSIWIFKANDFKVMLVL